MMKDFPLRRWKFSRVNDLIKRTD